MVAVGKIDLEIQRRQEEEALHTEAFEVLARCEFGHDLGNLEIAHLHEFDVGTERLVERGAWDQLAQAQAPCGHVQQARSERRQRDNCTCGALASHFHWSLPIALWHTRDVADAMQSHFFGNLRALCIGLTEVGYHASGSTTDRCGGSRCWHCWSSIP